MTYLRLEESEEVCNKHLIIIKKEVFQHRLSINNMSPKKVTVLSAPKRPRGRPLKPKPEEEARITKQRERPLKQKAEELGLIEPI